jgi:trans-2,3-dihydro-3-hydroxyanthranilate isomerase
MVVRIVLWSLADSKTTIEELRRYLRDEAVDEFAEVEGLRFKTWISDPLGERWGAFYLFESREAADQVLPTGVRELIGKDPEVVEEFDLEASIEGRFAEPELSRLGLAFE